MKTYTPAEASSESGFSLDTLRYYEREGILNDVGRSVSGHRVYTEDNLSTLGFLRCLRDTGMPIELLRRYGALCRDASTLDERILLLEEHAAGVRARQAELETQQALLAHKLAWYRSELSRSLHS